MRNTLICCLSLVSVALAATTFIGPQDAVYASAFSARAPVAVNKGAEPFPTIGRANDGLFYATGVAGSNNIRFLVDTGATHVLLSQADAKKIKRLSLPAERGKMMTVGGEVEVDWVVIDEISIEGVVLKGLKAAIPRRDMGLSLLGQAGLAQFDQIHIDGDELTLVSSSRTS